jgi:hypothetical protein
MFLYLNYIENVKIHQVNLTPLTVEEEREKKPFEIERKKVK